MELHIPLVLVAVAVVVGAFDCCIGFCALGCGKAVPLSFCSFVFFVDRKYFWRDGKLFSAKLFKGPLEKNGCYFWKCSADSSSSACVVSKPKNVANAATQ